MRPVAEAPGQAYAGVVVDSAPPPPRPQDAQGLGILLPLAVLAWALFALLVRWELRWRAHNPPYHVPRNVARERRDAFEAHQALQLRRRR